MKILMKLQLIYIRRYDILNNIKYFRLININ